MLKLLLENSFQTCTTCTTPNNFEISSYEFQLLFVSVEPES